MAQRNDSTDHDNLGIAQSGKLAVLDSVVAQIRSVAPHDKVVIVSNFTSALGLIQDMILKPRNLSFLRLDGSTELSSRQTLVDTFNGTSSERTFCFLLSSKAGGCGLNLIGANRLIMVDPDWNPASDIQAMARVICQCQIQKENLSSAVDSKKGGLGFTKEELKDCFTLKNVACYTKTKIGRSWPIYKGPTSIVSNGCDDAPLQVATISPELVSVHVADDSEPLVTVDEDDVVDEPSETSKEDWHDDILNGALPSAQSLMDGSPSSDEENELN